MLINRLNRYCNFPEYRVFSSPTTHKHVYTHKIKNLPCFNVLLLVVSMHVATCTISWLPLYLNSVILLIVANENADGRKLLRTQFNKDFSCFYVELPNGTILSHLVEENERFPAQFGREVSCMVFIMYFCSKYAYLVLILFPEKMEFANSCNIHNTWLCPNICSQDYLD